jgi:hypothetical protein
VITVNKIKLTIMKKQKLATALFLCMGLVLMQGNKSQAVVTKEISYYPQPTEVVNSEVSEKAEEESKMYDVNDPFYCQLPTKNMPNNYALIEENLDRSSTILYGDEPNEYNKEFLLEVAMVESRLGYLTNTYVRGGTKGKGVWQIQRNAFNATKDVRNNPELKPFLERFKQETGIDWVKDVKWEHCNYVFYGAVAAQLYMIAVGIEPKSTTALRAKQWKVHYNTYSGKGRPQDYIRKATRIDEFNDTPDPEPETEIASNSAM